MRTWGAVGAAAMAIAIGLGAFGAHALEDQLDADGLRRWQTAADYHVYHAIGILLVGALAPARATLIGGTFVAGLLLFSGSLYAMALSGQTWLGAITPIGGVAWIVGWSVFAVSLYRSRATA